MRPKTPAQRKIPCEISPEPMAGTVAGLGGVAVAGRAFRGMKLPDACEAGLGSLRRIRPGYTPGEVAGTAVCALPAGAGCVKDVDRLREDPAVAKMPGMRPAEVRSQRGLVRARRAGLQRGGGAARGRTGAGGPRGAGAHRAPPPAAAWREAVALQPQDHAALRRLQGEDRARPARPRGLPLPRPADRAGRPRRKPERATTDGPVPPAAERARIRSAGGVRGLANAFRAAFRPSGRPHGPVRAPVPAQSRRQNLPAVPYAPPRSTTLAVWGPTLALAFPPSTRHPIPQPAHRRQLPPAAGRRGAKSRSLVTSATATVPAGTVS
jgi:hypothetical protein